MTEWEDVHKPSYAIDDLCKQFRERLTGVAETMKYKIGDLVRKDRGDYTFEGHVVSAFIKKSGAIRYVVEDDRGLLFIFNEDSLKKVS